MLVYGWQDFLVYRLDNWMKERLTKQKDITQNHFNEIWYHHKTFLTMLSILSIGTHMVLISFCAVINNFEAYLVLNLIAGNLWLFFVIIYHYFSVSKYINNLT
jgi:hypothetical protein